MTVLKRMVERGSDPIPDRKNVYGHFVAPDGLQMALRVFQQLVGDDHASIDVSHDDGMATLHLSTEECVFASTPLLCGVEHIFNGAVAGASEDVVAFVTSLSDCLFDAGIEHRFEIYDEAHKLIAMLPE